MLLLIRHCSFIEVPQWDQCACRLYTVRMSNVHLMIGTCTQHRCHTDTARVSHGHCMGVTCALHMGCHISWESHVHSWVSRGQCICVTCALHVTHMQCTCKTYAVCHMCTACVSHAHCVGITCVLHGCRMYTSWVSHVHCIGCHILYYIGEICAPNESH